ncbi:MBOAT family O-acyltransferase [Flavobacterium sp. RSSA_27]|uniref:MBOAT family O-acyltransferase n=1 Tax=Flavobacterium sp. RSSA_27 TaxID=3447667 RepID=UPI003F3D6B45
MITLTDITNWLTTTFGSIDAQRVSEWITFNPKEPILFNTAFFLGLFLLFYPIYIVTTKAKTRVYRHIYVFAFSLFFYYKSSGIYFCLLLFSGLVDYTLAKFLYQETKEGYRKFFLVVSIIFNLSFLGYFKYSNFLIDNYNQLFEGQIHFIDVILPVGISFYTFQSMSYIIDIYRRELEPTKNLLDYMFFVSFFPQLVAGPIVRASEFIPQIYSKIHLTRKDFDSAVFLIMGGLIKKTVISDYISLNFVDRVFDSPRSYTAFENLMASYGYTIQIYCDFSGYSDMAIGIALLMGFRLSVNFRNPYQSASITEFWRRWHISLSTWLRDYLYISVGGNRKGSFGGFLFPVLFFVGLIAWATWYYPISAIPLIVSLSALFVFCLTFLVAKDKKRTLYTNVNLMTTMLLGGFWHGASLKFIIWGALHGVALAVNKMFSDFFPSPKDAKPTFWSFIIKIVSVLFTFHFVAFCWIFFRAKDFTVALDVLKSIASLRLNWEQWSTVIAGYQNVFLMILIGYVLHFIPSKTTSSLKKSYDHLPVLFKSLVLAFVFWLVAAMASSELVPFIYFQF